MLLGSLGFSASSFGSVRLGRMEKEKEHEGEKETKEETDNKKSSCSKSEICVCLGALNKNRE